MRFFLSYALLAAGLSAAQYPAGCPTITSHALCSTCPVNACLAYDTVTVPCGCPTAVPTTTVDHPCPTDPAASCFAPPCASTSHAIVTASGCSHSGGGGGCPTITSTVHASDCTSPTPFPGASTCVEELCIQVETVTWPCSCVTQGSMPTTTVTGACTCRRGCATTSQAFYLPCPTSIGGGDGPGCAA
ncbi:hypothetical protein VTK73DRAFT_9416 [Phialemonium thermophilum]|uniref:Uncharacterized protein n=1 Tax=Phialemonium thermophilum TaxID=223376 RepID=A0ABR3W2E3_9PEZI